MATRKVRANATYVFVPVLMDVSRPAHQGITVGQTVRVVNLHGCPPCGTMGMCHVQDLKGKFLGMVCCNSLQRKDDAPEALTAWHAVYGKK